MTLMTTPDKLRNSNHDISESGMTDRERHWTEFAIPCKCFKMFKPLLLEDPKVYIELFCHVFHYPLVPSQRLQTLFLF